MPNGRACTGTASVEPSAAIRSSHQDGFALIRQLRQEVDGGANVRALALTAYASADDERRILAAGFDAYMTKPIDATELVEAVARLARP